MEVLASLGWHCRSRTTPALTTLAAWLGTGAGHTALEANADALGVPLGNLDCVVISHLHSDHVGGVKAQVRHRFSFGRERPVPRAITALVPTDMTHPEADVAVVGEARVIGRVSPCCRRCPGCSSG